MEFLIALAALAIYLTLCALVGDYAAKKGQSWGLFTLLAVIISPVLTLIVALIVEDKSQGSSDRDAPEPESSNDDLERLKKLGELHTSGVLTDEEFAAEKARVLAPDN